jgi:hypothetical protein
MKLFNAKQVCVWLFAFFFLLVQINYCYSQTIALWLFDEQIGLYPSSVLNESSDNDFPMVLGLGGQIVVGKFGNAVEPLEQPKLEFPTGSVFFGLQTPEPSPGSTVEPLLWMNAKFCALMTAGEKHLRKQVGFKNATGTALNLGNSDWTVEFWFQSTRITDKHGVIFEIGSGPRGNNDKITQLNINNHQDGFVFVNQSTGLSLEIPSQPFYQKPPQWHHCAFVYDARNKQLKHFRDGKLMPLPVNWEIIQLEQGNESYFSLARDGNWENPLPGKLDELRFSKGQVYTESFTPPGSFGAIYQFREGVDGLAAGKELLFKGEVLDRDVIDLEDRKHLFIDDAFIQKLENIIFNVNPPRLAEKVIDNINIPFRKHLSIIEDENGVIRLYNGTYNDFLAVRTSTDGVNWDLPDLGRGEYRGLRNIVLKEPTAMGSVFIDPNAPPERRWKYISDYHRRGIFLYSSRDGWSFKRHKTALLPFRSGSQSNVFYDEQRQLYVGYHRSDCTETPAGETQRTFVLTEVRDILNPWHFKPVYATTHPAFALRDPQPWFLDNGPLTPGGFCQEYPIIFYPENSDPVGTDIYVPKGEKYAWAPDTYVAFPIAYFHYESDGPVTRQILMHPDRARGSGPIETQLAVSRDGVHWKRYQRPTYVGIGNHEGIDVHQAYMAQGMVRRGNEIWQYYYGTAEYHSAWVEDNENKAVFRVVQRLDGFISADAPYDREGLIITHPFTFKGNRLKLNIDTDATGYCQVGILDESGRYISGYSLENSVYINGDFIDIDVEWIGTGKDVSKLAGKNVQLVFRMRASRLFAMHFITVD